MKTINENSQISKGLNARHDEDLQMIKKSSIASEAPVGRIFVPQKENINRSTIKNKINKITNEEKTMKNFTKQILDTDKALEDQLEALKAAISQKKKAKRTRLRQLENQWEAELLKMLKEFVSFKTEADQDLSKVRKNLEKAFGLAKYESNDSVEIEEDEDEDSIEDIMNNGDFNE